MTAAEGTWQASDGKQVLRVKHVAQVRNDARQSGFGMRIDFFSVFKGAFSLMKKPLKFMPSVYANSETAVLVIDR